MSKIKWTEKKIEERQRDGYGCGRGAAYKPWLEVQDLSSLGRSRRMWSHKTGRVHHLFSDVERDLFIACEWSHEVVDIREQFPLDREITQTLAHELGIRHPHYPTTNVPTVMTVDFLLTLRREGNDSLLALNAKRDEEAEEENSLLKLEIQRSYFEAMGIPHHLMYHSQLPKQKLTNIYWIRDAQLSEGEVEPRPGMFSSLKTRMALELAASSSQHQPLHAYCDDFDSRYGVDSGTGLRVARMLMQERALMANLEAKNLAAEPVSSFVMTAMRGSLRAVGGV